MEALYYLVADNLNYWWILVFMAIESSFIPFPSEIVIIPAAYLANQPNSEMSLSMIVLAGTVGALIGALVNYGLSVWLGRPIIYKFADTKIAHMLLIDRPGVEKAEEYFKRKGVIGTLIGRLIPAIRQLISIPAGLAKMNLTTFIVCTVIGAGIWNAILAAIGHFFGKTMQQDELIALVQQYSGYVKLGIAVIVAVGLAYYIYKVVKANRESMSRKQ